MNNNHKPFTITKNTILLLILIIVVLITIIAYLAKPKALNITTPAIDTPQLAVNKLDGVVFTGKKIPIPPSLDVYSANTPLSPQNIVDNLIALYKLDPPQYPNYYRSSENNASLSYTPSREYLTFNNFSDTPLLRTDYSENQAVDKAKEFLKATTLNNTLTIVANPIYLTKAQEPSPTTKQNASFLSMVFEITLPNDYPLIHKNQPTSSFTIWLDANYNVVKAIIPAISINIISQQKSATINIDEAINQINHGKYTIVNFGALPQSTYPESLSNANLSQVVLEYRLAENNPQLIPYYRFTGTSAISPSSNGVVEVITPAIPTQ